MVGLNELLKEHALRKEGILERLAGFKKLRGAPDEKLFYELCFCVMTANGSAKAGLRAQECLEQNRVWHTGKPGSCLSGVRFGKIKAGYIRQNWRNLKKGGLDLSVFVRGNPFEVREKIVADKMHFKGLGYKEAGHFLRNIGRGGDLAILDRHILAGLCGLKVICNVPDSLGRKRYLEIEKKMQVFSQEVGIPMEELDLLFWSMRTGVILK